MGVIKVKRIDVRRVVSDACHELISDEKIAEMVYMKIMHLLEDYLDDCEEIEKAMREARPTATSSTEVPWWKGE